MSCPIIIHIAVRIIFLFVFHFNFFLKNYNIAKEKNLTRSFYGTSKNSPWTVVPSFTVMTRCNDTSDQQIRVIAGWQTVWWGGRPAVLNNWVPVGLVWKKTKPVMDHKPSQPTVSSVLPLLIQFKFRSNRTDQLKSTSKS